MGGAKDGAQRLQAFALMAAHLRRFLVHLFAERLRGTLSRHYNFATCCGVVFSRRAVKCHAWEEFVAGTMMSESSLFWDLLLNLDVVVGIPLLVWLMMAPQKDRGLTPDLRRDPSANMGIADRASAGLCDCSDALGKDGHTGAHGAADCRHVGSMGYRLQHGAEVRTAVEHRGFRA